MVLSVLTGTILLLCTPPLLAWIRNAFQLESMIGTATASPWRWLMLGTLFAALMAVALIPRGRHPASEKWRRRFAFGLSATQSAIICVTVALALAAVHSWNSRLPTPVPFELSDLRVIEFGGPPCPEKVCLNLGEFERRIDDFLGDSEVRVAVSGSTHPLPNLIGHATHAWVGPHDFAVEVNYVSGRFFAVLDPRNAPATFAELDAVVDADFAALAELPESLPIQAARVSADTVSLTAIYPYSANSALTSTGEAALPVAYVNKPEPFYGVAYLWLRDVDSSVEQRIITELIEPLGLRARAFDAADLEAESLKRERALAALIGLIALASYAILIANVLSDLIRRWREQQPTLAICYALGMTRIGLYWRMVRPVLISWLAGVFAAAALLPRLYIQLEDVLFTEQARFAITATALGAFALAFAVLLILMWTYFRRAEIGAWLKPAGEGR